MRKLLLLSTALALFATFMSVNLWRGLGAERERNASLEARLAEAGSGATRPTTSLGPATEVPAVADRGMPEPASRALITAAPAAININLLDQRDMLKDPEYRDARLAQMRLQLPQIYPDVAEELDLSPEQADRLLDLLAENQLELSGTARIALGPDGRPDAAQMQEMQRTQQEIQTRQEAKLTSLLGGTGYNKWQQYLQTIPERQQFTQLGRSMDAAGLSFTSAQKKPLTELFVAEQARQRQEQQAMLRDLRVMGQSMDAQTSARLREETLKRQTETNRRLVDAAAAYLNPQQLDLFRKSLDGQLALNRASARLRNEADVNRPAPPPLAPH